MCSFLRRWGKIDSFKSKTFQNTPTSEIDIINKHDLLTQPLNATPPHRNIPTMYWLSILYKHPFKFRLILASSKQLVIYFCNWDYESSDVNHFWSV